MRRGRIFIFLALIIVLVLIGVWYAQRTFLQPQPTSEVEGGPAPEPVIQMAEILVVTQFVSRGDVIKDEILGTIEFPQESVIPGMFYADQKEAVVDRQARMDIDAGMPLTAGMLVDIGETLSDVGSIAALSIPAGKVAIPVKVGRAKSVAYALRPGDHVSVIATCMVVDVDTEFQSPLPNATGGVISTGKASENEPSYLTVTILPVNENAIIGRTELDPLLNELVYVMPRYEQAPRLVTQILMQDAIVLRYGEFPYDDLTPQEGQGETAEDINQGPENPPTQQQGEGEEAAPPEAPAPDIVTLIVTPQEAVALEHLMKSNAEFTLVLRASGDTDPIDTEAVTFQYLLETYNIPVPAKLPYSLVDSTNWPPSGE
jgi:pilus assembly protein CpaB